MSHHFGFVKKLALPLGLLALVLIYAAGIPDVRSQFDEGLIGTRSLPKGLVVLALACLGVILLREARAPAPETPEDQTGAWKPYGLFAAILAYVALFKPVGFVLTTAGLCLIIMWLFEYETGRPLRRILAAGVITGLAYLLFAVAFGTRLALWPGMG